MTQEDEIFFAHWAANRDKEKKSLKPFLIGLSGGFCIGISLWLILETGWYERANMEANSRMSPVTFMAAILLLSLFLAFFYRKFRWEMREQRYHEILASKKRKESGLPVQP